jgi:L-malate glycosyltransferase
MGLRALILCTTKLDKHIIQPEIEQIIGLSKKGVDIKVITEAGTEYSKLLSECGIQVINNFPKRKISLKSIKYIRSILKEEKFDVVHAFERKGIANAAFACIGIDVKLIIYRGAFRVHWYDPTSYLTTLHPRVDKVVCVSLSVENHVKRQMIRKNRTTAIYKGQHKKWFKIEPASLKSVGLPKDAFVVASLARHEKIKGIKYLVEAANMLKKYENMHFVLIGKGLTDKYLKGIHVENENIHCLGFRKDALNIVAMADLYVQPSLKEGLSRSLMEAMIIGKPVVVSNVGGMKELVQHMKSGILVEPKSPLKIAAAIRFLKSNEEIRFGLAKKAKKRIKKEFSIETAIENIYELYKSTVT